MGIRGARSRQRRTQPSPLARLAAGLRLPRIFGRTSSRPKGRTERRRAGPADLGKRLGSPDLVAEARRQAKSGKGRGQSLLAFSWGGGREQARAPRASRVSQRPSLPARPKRARRQGPVLEGPGRIKLILAFLGLFGAALLGRAVHLQLMQGEQFQVVAERQATTLAQIKAKRGVIKDRHGGELAITVDVDSVYAEPRRVKEPALVARQLAPVLGVKAAPLEKKLSSGKAFVYLKRRVDLGLAQRVQALKLEGIGTHPEPKRFYSNVSLAAHTLGFTSLEGEGKAGIERAFDGDLQGKSWEIPSLRDALGNKVLTEGLVPQAVLEGADVVLTLDRQIQHAAEDALKATVEKYHAKGGVALVLEPKSGDLLALASFPTFNPNNLAGTGPEQHLNRAVSAVFEPGSTMKMVTVAAALDAGEIRADERVDCEGGKWKVGGRTIGDANHAYGELTIAEVLKVSSNICAAKIGMKLGKTQLHDWLFRFGFGEPTGVELPGELRGLIRPAEKWRDITLANVAFGQGISVTPLQIVQAAAVIANDGVRVPPRLVREVVDKSGEARRPERPEPTRVLSSATAKAVAEMMVEVTQKGGTAQAAAVPGFRVSGKTGTAQKIDPVSRAYSHELYIASFVGFVPAEKPEVVILVLVDEPKGSIYGGTVAAPAFRQIALAALAAREVFPEDPAAKETFLLSYQAAPRPAPAAPGPSGAAPDRSETALDLGDMAGPEAKVDPLETALSAEAMALLGLAQDGAAAPGEGGRRRGGEGKGPGKMPNFAGLRLHEVLNRSAEARCDPVVTGSGRVVSQSPAPGSPLGPGARCEVKLSPSG